MQQLTDLYIQLHHSEPTKVEPLAKAGSNRQYFRIYDAEGHTIIGVKGTSTAENHSFIYLARHFASKGLPVPQILAVSKDETCYLQSDLGKISLYDALSQARKNAYRYDAEEKKWLEATIRQLPHIQIEGAKGLHIEECIPPLRFTQRAAMFDLNYFKYSFLKTTDLPFDEESLEDDLEQLAKDLADGDTDSNNFFLYRDFQARNVMLSSDGTVTQPYFIDFQGGMLGPLQYDVASFLWQASAHYPQSLREHLINAYLEELRRLLPDVDANAFRKKLQKFVFFRLLQVLGAYGLRGYVERKAYFLNSIPLAIRSLSEQLEAGCADAYPYLKETLRKLCALPRFVYHQSVLPQPTAKGDEEKKPLVVRVFSFSYKKGIPTDTSGNGGGYVFDCRSTHNPGRYAPYKHLTGLDRPVIEFLEDDGEILTFLQSVYRLADAHVERYLQRGFTDLMFSFGCTGGQHRSVYSAQHLAEHLNQKYGIEVRLEHREQHIHTLLQAH